MVNASPDDVVRETLARTIDDAFRLATFNLHDGVIFVGDQGAWFGTATP